MIPPAWLTRLYARLARQPQCPPYFLNPQQWLYAADGERMRVDRNGSVLAVVSLSLTPDMCTPTRLEKLGCFLSERLRQTDTAGWRPDGRLGLLLPDTPRSGAEVVAGELVEFVDVNGDRPATEIEIYPGPAEGAFGGELEQELPAAQADELGVAVAGQSEAPQRRFARAMPRWKRAIDIAGASAGLVIAGPALLTLAGAVVLTSRGGAFYRQEREGLAGKRFQILKLRTMVPEAEAQKASLRRHSVQDGPAFKMYRDPRVTTVGRFLRATSLDELPQLINVLRGDMSLVGPRPLPVDESQACLPWQRRRLQVTPGITCTWQVNGRNTVAFDEWMRMDMRYMRSQSLLADLRLLVATPAAVLLSRGPR